MVVLFFVLFFVSTLLFFKMLLFESSCYTTLQLEKPYKIWKVATGGRSSHFVASKINDGYSSWRFACEYSKQGQYYILKQFNEYVKSHAPHIVSTDQINGYHYDQTTSKIDWGNQQIGLDLIPRDDNGKVLSAEDTTLLRLYRVHEAVGLLLLIFFFERILFLHGWNNIANPTIHCI